MSPSSSSRSFRRRAAIAPLAIGLLVIASACGSDGDSDSDAAAGTTDSVAVADPPIDTAVVDTAVVDTAMVDTAVVDTAVPGTLPAEETGGGDATAMCGGLSAADVGAAVGVEFDSASDISVDTDETCLFSHSTGTDGVTVLTESADTYLAGIVAGLPSDVALAQLGQAQSIVLEDGYVVEQTTVGGFPAVTITGTNAMVAIPTGYASTVADGTVVEVTLDGPNLPTDSAALAPLAAAVLELAVAANG